MNNIDNFKRLQSMSFDEFAEWLDKYLAFDNAPHMRWFSEKYCSNCESIMCKYEDGTREFPCAYCEVNGKCKFFPDLKDVPSSLETLKLWLREKEFINDRSSEYEITRR